MPRGRRTPQTAAALQRAVNHVELLEDRKLLTTLVGGDTFDYYDAAGQTVRLRLVGNITAEFIAVRNGRFGNKIVRDLVASTATGLTPGDGADLFSIYISQADSDAQILMSRVPNPSIQTGVAPDTAASPLGGGGSVRVSTGTGTALLALGEGGVYIGNRNPLPPAGQGQPGNTGLEPVTVLPYRYAYGVRPAMRALYAGIQTAPGVDIGKIFVGGTVTGTVGINGNVGTFYAGNILTGDTQGTFDEGSAQSPNNFYVGGDLRNLLVTGSVGTVGANESYNTGAGIRVDGKLGYIDVGGTLKSTVNVINSPSISGIAGPIEEIEYIPTAPETEGSAFLTGELSFFANDTDADGQFASGRTAQLTGEAQTIEWSGTLQGGPQTVDPRDTYSLALMAGQTVVVDLTPDIENVIFTGVYDPNGKLIHTDVFDKQGNDGNGRFRFTADHAGTYQFVVTSPDTTGTLIDFATPLALGADVSYTLSIQNVGNLGIGGIRTGGDAVLEQFGNTLNVRTGDFGALISQGDVLGGAESYFNIARGNLRTIDAVDIGTLGLIRNESPQLLVPYGSVGLLRTDGVLNVNPFATIDGEEPNPAFAIGFDYQRVEAGGSLVANLVANRRIGIIHADSVPAAPIFAANANNGREQDGRIDLIDIVGQFGSAVTGGPHISTGFGGNVKYLRVGGTVFNDTEFGGGQNLGTTGRVGQSLTFTDDSGARAIISPTTITGDATGGADGGGGDGGGDNGNGEIVSTSGNLTVLTYGIRGSGGAAIVRVSSATNVTINVQGNRGSFDVASVDIAGDGTEAFFSVYNHAVGYQVGTQPIIGSAAPATETVAGGDGETGAQLFSTPAVDNRMTLTGQLPINLFDVQNAASASARNDLLNLNTIDNRSGGEIVGVRANTIGTIRAERIGYMDMTTAEKLLVDTNIGQIVGNSDYTTPNAITDADRPAEFDSNSYGIFATGSIVELRSEEGIGNVVASRAGSTDVGRIGTILPNYGNVDRTDAFEGIVGVLWANAFTTINIGEGLSFGGTGQLPTSGIFTASTDAVTVLNYEAMIDTVRGRGADIRGTIHAVNLIRRIQLSGGSIVGAEIATGTFPGLAGFLQRAQEALDIQFDSDPYMTGTIGTSDGTAGGDGEDPITGDEIPQFDLGKVQVTGGGIMNTRFFGGDFQSISVSDGFGVIASTFLYFGQFQGSGTIYTDGLGVRAASINPGNSMGGVIAEGNGQRLNVLQYPETVRQSERRRFDSATGRELSGASDLHLYLGTSRNRPAVSGVTNAGIIEDTAITGNKDIKGVTAFHMRSTQRDIKPSSGLFPMRISFASSTGIINVASSIDGLRLRTGRMSQLNAGGNMENIEVQASGRVGQIVSGRNIRGSVSFNISGPEGYLDRLYAKRGYYGTTRVSRDVGEITVQTYGGTVEGSQNIDALIVGGDVTGTGYLRATNTLGKLQVVGDILEGAVIQAKKIEEQFVGGTVFGQILIK